MSKLGIAIGGTLATAAIAGGAIVGYQQLSGPNTSNTNSNVWVQQADTKTAFKNNLLGTWINVDDPNMKYDFTENEVTISANGKEEKARYNPLCSGQVIEITEGEFANTLLKATVEDGVLTLAAMDTRIKLKREQGSGSPPPDTPVQDYQPAKNDLIGTWVEKVAEADEKIGFAFTADKVNSLSGEKGASYKFLCEQVVETKDDSGFIVIAKTEIKGDELTWTAKGQTQRFKRESANSNANAKVDYSKFKEFKSLTGHTGVVFSVAFSPDGKTLASASYDYTVKLWRAE